MSDDCNYYNIEGANGTIAPQKDEAYYDDRSDASDDMEKGRLKFPTKMYGRERELEMLQSIYSNLIRGGMNCDDTKDGIGTVEEEEEEVGEDDKSDTTKNQTSCIFLGGYSGIGKSALVYEFIKQTQRKHPKSPMIYSSGKYTEQSTASVPFSAISEVLESLAFDLSNVGEEVQDKQTKRKKRGLMISSEMKTKVWNNIRESELIGVGTEGNRVLRKTFPVLIPLLNSCKGGKSTEEEDDLSDVHPTMNSIKESTCGILSIISKTLEYPPIIFLDDWQWADEASFDMLSFLVSNHRLRRVMFICAYRSNEVDADHSFAKLMDAAPTEYIQKMDLFSLSPEAITLFIADSVKKEQDDEGVAELAEAVYEKTMGNIFYTMQALEELVRKNIVFYDMMCFEWRWVLKKVELANYMSDDVVESVKGKLEDLPENLQFLLIVMGHVPHNNLDVALLGALMSHGERMFDENTVRKLLKQASEESMLMLSVENSNYKFAHDRIRQASVEYAAQNNVDYSLQLHISQVLMDFAQGPTMEWCLFVAVDLLNSIPPDKTSRSDLIKLNMRVASIAKNKGSRAKENELLHHALKSLRSSGIMWKGKHYDLTLEVYNAAIESDFALGNYNEAKNEIDSVLKNASSLDDMIVAYLRQLLCKMEETLDYAQGVQEGITILNKYGFEIPGKLTKACMMKEEMKLKLAMRNRSFSCLTELPLCPQKYDPMFLLLRQMQLYAIFSGNEDLQKIIVWKSIEFSIKHGMGRLLPTILAFYSGPLAVNGKVDTAQEIGNVAIALTDKIRGDLEVCATTKGYVYGCVLTQLQSFRSSLDPLLQAYKDLKIVGGDVQSLLGSMMGYFDCYYCAGCELGPLLESKILVIEDLSRSLGRQGFLTSFQINRQFALNLRQRIDNPTEFQGEAFNEKDELSEMSENARKMALRDSSAKRLCLAFIFWNEEAMVDMLQILADYPLKDMSTARLYHRLCFVGLAIFGLSHRKDCQSFAKLGKSCLTYFADLSKHGSVNAKPVHLFMLAMKSPSKLAYEKAIDACAEASMIHLEAMANERYAAYLMGEKKAELAKDYLTKSYWLYQDWGAHGKNFNLSQQHDYLKDPKRPRKTASSATMSLTSSSDRSTVPVYTFNTTFKKGSVKRVKKLK